MIPPPRWAVWLLALMDTELWPLKALVVFAALALGYQLGVG